MTEMHADTATNGTRPTPAGPLNVQPMLPSDYPDVPFGKGDTQRFPHEWASWILTQMRESELKGEKPRPFSAWCAACVMANRG